MDTSNLVRRTCRIFGHISHAPTKETADYVRNSGIAVKVSLKVLRNCDCR